MIDSMWYVANTDKFSTSVRPSPLQNVVPDGIGPTITLGDNGKKTKGVLGLIGAKGKFAEAVNFAEVKALKTKSLGVGYNKRQLAGMIDYLGNDKNKKGKKGARPHMIIITTFDTKIGKSLENFATKKGVALFHSVAEITDDGSGDIRAGTPKLLNPIKSEIAFEFPTIWQSRK